MRRSTFAALAAAAALAGCPLPQPLPDYPAGTITPPRILVDEVEAHGRPVRLVPAGCAVEPEYALAAQLYDANNLETVEARWFVNYDERYFEYFHAVQDNTIVADPDPLELRRAVPPFAFHPYQHQPPPGTGTRMNPPYDEAQTIRVVELVVSNGFDPAATTPPLPERRPLPTFETQVYRWVFLLVPESAGTCEPADPSCVKCP